MISRCILLSLLWLVSAHADTLIFRNGVKSTGTWVGIDAERVRFIIDGQLHVYSRADVVTVIFGDN